MFISEFNEVWSETLATHNNQKLLLLGDFNIHADNPLNSDTKSFMEMLSNYDCHQHVNCQTHESGHTIDLCITPCSTRLKLSTPAAGYFLSDHAFIDFFLSIPKPPLVKATVQSRPIASIDSEVFKNDLSNIIDEIISSESDDIASQYDTKLSMLLDKHAPLVSKSVTIKPKVAWFDKTAKDLKRNLRKLHSKWKLSREEDDFDVYKVARNHYRQHLDASKRSHFSDAISAAHGNPRKLFSITMGLMGKKADNPLPSSDSSSQLANDFANYFIDKISNIRSSLEQYPRYQPTGSCSAVLPAFQICTEQSVSKIITKAKSATCQLDPIPTSLVKANEQLLTPLITKIVNKSLESGVFFDDWKTAIVQPLLKKSGLEPIYSNYRPVSNLSFLSKIAEKEVIHQLNNHFTENDLHFDHQSAYKQSFSTETALCILVNDLLWAMEESKITALVALDLSAAFDTVDHGILCSVLDSNFGVNSSALDWIRSYLKDRKLQVKVGDSNSTTHTFNYSVPQGSCLGPVLFNVYASTISECIPHNLSLGGYADDHIIKAKFDPTNTERVLSCIESIESTLLSVHNWMSSNRLKMNPTKTEVIFFGSDHTLRKNPVSTINVAGDDIQAIVSLKYLGAHLDSSLTFEDFIQHKCRTAITNIKNIHQIRNYIDLKVAKQLAVSLVLSHLDYSNGILAGVPSCRLRPLQRVQNWAARVVLCRSKLDSAHEALYHLHWLPIKERIDFKIACLVFKCLNGQAPQPLSQLISLKTFGRRTRASTAADNELSIPFVRKSRYAMRSFSVYGPTTWNALPADIRRIDSFNSFKKQLKTHLFKRAFNN